MPQPLQRVRRETGGEQGLLGAAVVEGGGGGGGSRVRVQCPHGARAWEALRRSPRHRHPPGQSGPLKGRGAERGGGMGSRAEVPGTPTYIPQNDPLVALIIWNTHMWGFLKKICPPGGPVRAARVWGGWMGGGQGSENFVMFCRHIWIPHEILSILRINAWRKNEILPPTGCQNNVPAPNWDQMWSGPSKHSGHLEGGLWVSRAAAGRPPSAPAMPPPPPPPTALITPHPSVRCIHRPPCAHPRPQGPVPLGPADLWPPHGPCRRRRTYRSVGAAGGLTGPTRLRSYRGLG